MKNEQIARDYCKKISALYEEHNGQYYGNPRQSEIIFLWKLLYEALGRMTLQKQLFVLSSVNRPGSRHCIEIALKAVPKCKTLEQVKSVWPFIPKVRKTERSLLLRRAIELARNKEEVLDCLQTFGYIEP